MPCLEGKIGNLTENDVQIEVQLDHSDKIDSVLEGVGHIDENIINENDRDQDINQFDENDSTTLPSDEYQLIRDRQRRQIRYPAKFYSDDFVFSFTYQRRN